MTPSIIEEAASSCTFCGACVEVCPFFKVTKNPKYGAMAKVEAAIALFEGKELSKEEVNTLLLCTRCDGCHSSCPMEIPISQVVQAARAELRRVNAAPEKYKTIADAIIKTGSPMGAPLEKRRVCIPGGFKPPDRAEYLYVTGCWSAIKLPETAMATMELLMKAGVDFTILGEKEWCCGLFLIDTGMVEEAKELAKKNTLLFESTGARTVVTECPSCHDVFKNIYPALFRSPKYEVIHISELLEKVVGEGRLRLSPETKRKKVVYKDPCPLARRNGILRPPRKVLSAVCELLEYDECGRDALCCGAPAGVKPLYPEISNKLAELLMVEAKEKGAAEVGVGCVFCMYHMGGLQKEAGYPPIKTLSQILLEMVE
ncbi:MAG: (Fe-S)-binding protein [Candidatus Verstraetearchaeota archaeon]|nr:(Fe-S)-binding protein [Candidatus Verstraetearchaeota archaeon]